MQHVSAIVTEPPIQTGSLLLSGRLKKSLKWPGLRAEGITNDAQTTYWRLIVIKERNAQTRKANTQEQTYRA
jgi:hypothetical protein